MTDSDQVSAATDGPDRSQYLANLLTVATERRSSRGAAWLAEAAVDPVTGEQYTRQAVARLLRGAQTSVPIPLVRGVSAATALTQQEIWDASGYASGLEVGPAAQPTFARYFPPALDGLSESAIYAIRDMAIVLARAEGLIT